MRDEGLFNELIAYPLNRLNVFATEFFAEFADMDIASNPVPNPALRKKENPQKIDTNKPKPHHEKKMEKANAKRKQESGGGPSEKKKCFNCNRMGHLKSACTFPPYCYHCKGSGHKSDACPKKGQDA